MSEPVTRTPLFGAEQAPRYERQSLIAQYQEMVGVNLIVVIDDIMPVRMTILEELLFDCDPAKDLHVLLASPGGDGETALRMVRSMQLRCKELTVIVPDMAKSAATILCLGAHRILMGPGGDLGPIDPQMIRYSNGRPVGASSAKEIVAAVDEAEERVTRNPSTVGLFASLLSEVNMLVLQQAKSALARSESLMAEALKSTDRLTPKGVKDLTRRLQAPLIKVPTSHSAVITADDALDLGLPVEKADPASAEWRLLWSLWSRYFALGCFPAGNVPIYEAVRASHAG
ncbi:MAG: hypothetical protein LBE08_13685 [Bifidobacteriaceae bacterium]|jgi:hypothetical protein|nr:hypothetical protein [Bifidobacteriaceae bacterium]